MIKDTVFRILLFFFLICIPFFQGAGHNDVELHGQYFDRLRKFLNVELVK